jgi:membrane associated rhomboid family serine protease
MINEKITKNTDCHSLVDNDMKIWSQKGTFIIFGILLMVYIAYQTKFLKVIPCENGILNGFLRSFIHISTKHLLANLAGIYLLYRAEVQVGTWKFIRVFFSILTISVVLESIYGLIFDNECSIGFSGVLFGFAAWSLLTDMEIEYTILFGLVGFMIVSSINNVKASLSGHVCGLLAGVITALYMGKVQKNPIHKEASF